MFNIKIYNNRIKLYGFPINLFKNLLRKKYKSTKIANIFDQEIIFFSRGIITIHNFFLPEFVYIIKGLNHTAFNKYLDDILNYSWMKDIDQHFSNIVNTNRLKNIKYTLKDYQKNFILLYNEKKQKYKLNGYILAFEQGLGKTLTSLALMECLNKKTTVIIAPKSTLKTVWKKEIQTVFNDEQSIWVIGDKPKRCKYYIVNYESIDKLSSIIKYFGKSVGFIIDECHNFRNSLTKRVNSLEKIIDSINCNDILMLSGTPIKAMGSEMIPALRLLDYYFDDEAEKIFKKVFGMKQLIALDIMKNRLGLMMHRKLKAEVFKLPPKNYQTVKIKIPNGKQYTLEKVRDTIAVFIKERQKFYFDNFHIYESDFNEVIEYLKTTSEGETEAFNQYLETIKELKKSGYKAHDAVFIEKIRNLNIYEKKVLRPLLPPDLRRKFDSSRSVIKYVDMKIMGEVIGGLLSKLRTAMFKEMIEHSPLCSIIQESSKKTICFTTFVDVAKNCSSYISNKCKMQSVSVYGETSSNITSIFKSFREDKKINPLIATIQTLSTGVTLTEANTVVFLNEPWRYVDKIQAEDRVHRIGQDTVVEVFTFILDTGDKLNLSTRMEEIVSWSKNMFDGIVGEQEKEKQLNPIIKRLMGYIPK